jgi:hypothetical protein
MREEAGIEGVYEDSLTAVAARRDVVDAAGH